MIACREARYNRFLLLIVLACLVTPNGAFNIKPSINFRVSSGDIDSTSAGLLTSVTSLEPPPTFSPPVPGAALNPIWSKIHAGKYYPYSSTDHGSDLVELSGGGYALIGTTTGPSGEENVWVIGTDENGTELWNSSLGGPYIDKGMAGVECSTGGLIIGGYTQGIVDDDLDFWMILTDATGNPLWSKTFGGTDDDFAKSVIECSGGGFAIVGNTWSFGAGSWDVWLIRTDSSGNHLWNVTFGGASGDYGYDIVECSGGGFAILASTSSFGAGVYDVWLIRTDASGNHLWDVTYGGTGSESGSGLVECAGGGFAIIGYTGPSFSGRDFWLLRTDTSGTLLWDKTFGGSEIDVGSDIAECAGGGFVLSGTTKSFGNGDYDIWVVRTDGLGEGLWTQAYGSPRRDESGGIVECSEGGFTVIGSLADSVGRLDVWLFRIPDPEICWYVTPEDKIVEYGANFEYELRASSLQGIDQWWMNDTTGFNLNPEGFHTNTSVGVLTNASTLSVGDYGLQVFVNDTADNRINANITINIESQAPPTWVEAPTNQVVELGSSFYYYLDATDRSGIDSWWLTSGGPFTISSHGDITNTGALSLAVYNIEVWVNDSLGNALSATFQVQVVDTTAPSISWLPIDINHELGDPFNYYVSAYDRSGIDSWWIDDTTHFTINDNGKITNVTFLPIGEYLIRVWVNDTQGNTQNDKIALTVVDTIAPTILNTPAIIHGYPESVSYQFEAYDLSGVSGWGVSDTTNFRISSSGLLTNHRVLNQGRYDLTVYVSDARGNVQHLNVRIDIFPSQSTSFVGGLVMVGLVSLFVLGCCFLIIRVFRNRPSVSEVQEEEPDSIAHTRRERPTRYNCRKCGAQITGDKATCQKCGAKQRQCTVCQGFIEHKEQYLQCPHCKQLAHKRHLLEWLKVKGQCPYCRRKLRRKDVV